MLEIDINPKKLQSIMKIVKSNICMKATINFVKKKEVLETGREKTASVVCSLSSRLIRLKPVKAHKQHRKAVKHTAFGCEIFNFIFRKPTKVFE